jgi:hypothetical protein
MKKSELKQLIREEAQNRKILKEKTDKASIIINNLSDLLEKAKQDFK